MNGCQNECKPLGGTHIVAFREFSSITQIAEKSICNSSLFLSLISRSSLQLWVSIHFGGEDHCLVASDHWSHGFLRYQEVKINIGLADTMYHHCAKTQSSISTQSAGAFDLHILLFVLEILRRGDTCSAQLFMGYSFLGVKLYTKSWHHTFRLAFNYQLRKGNMM